MLSKCMTGVIATFAFGALASGNVLAQDTVKIGLIMSMTGQQASTGKQIKAAVDLYMQEHGDIGRGQEDGGDHQGCRGRPRQHQTSGARIDRQRQGQRYCRFRHHASRVGRRHRWQPKPRLSEVVMAAGTSIITEQSPYIVRTSFTLPQSSVIIADWAAKNNIKKVVPSSPTMPRAPMPRSRSANASRLPAARSPRRSRCRWPIPDFAPFLQRAADAKPDAIFMFVPSGQGGTFMKQFAERGLDKAGIKLIGPGDVTDDDLLPGMGDAVIGAVTAHFYSADHKSGKNKAYVEAFKKANNFRPNFMSVGGYDGMHLIYEALKKTGGKADGDSLIAAMKGMKWESPRGPISIDPETRDIVQNIYIRKVEKKDGELYNVEFATFEAVKDPVKAASKK